MAKMKIIDILSNIESQNRLREELRMYPLRLRVSTWGVGADVETVQSFLELCNNEFTEEYKTEILQAELVIFTPNEEYELVNNFYIRMEE